jgi:hypothetical protein
MFRIDIFRPMRPKKEEKKKGGKKRKSMFVRDAAHTTTDEESALPDYCCLRHMFARGFFSASTE